MLKKFVALGCGLMFILFAINMSADDSVMYDQSNQPVVSTTQNMGVDMSTQPGVITPQSAAQNDTWTDKLILYVPNLFMNAFDIVDVSVGFGPTVKAKTWATRYFAFGGGIGGSAKLIKGWHRQYGVGLQSGWNASFMMLSAENTEMTNTSRDVQSYFNHYTGIPSTDNSVYNFWRGPEDMYSIGAQGAIFAELDAEVHPVAIANFVCGIFFIDLTGTNLKMSDFK